MSDRSLGLPSGVVLVVPYDAAWPVLFEAERARLEQVFAERGLRVTVEHSGSTAVPGLAAKPVLDILGGYEADAVASLAS